MDNDWAADHLQTIRTLMERSAIYRRALAPIMTFCGVVGVIAGGLGWKLDIHSTRGFVWFWSTVAAAALLGSFLLVRRQAMKDSEPFWSPPTRRVAQAMLLPLVIGLIAGITVAIGFQAEGSEVQSALIFVWAWLYGCALHSAGFIISRGIRILGWIYGLMGCALLASLPCMDPGYLSPHLLMGGIFGALHLACGIYLYFTEKRGNES